MASEDLKKEIHFALENATLGRTLGNFCKTYPARREKSYEGVDFQNTREKIAEVKTYAAEHIDEMIAEFSNFSDDFGLKLRADENNETLIKFDYKEKKLVLDRSRGEQPDKKPRKVYLGDIEKLNLRIFVDNSSVEVFVNGGKEVFSSRIFPQKNADGIKVFSEGNVDVKIEKWEWQD